ncbi:putative MFS transporter [Xylaria sp. CBS 124048]|nr:putative MFS transporter [Xylaria sp. CBS 124048]
MTSRVHHGTSTVMMETEPISLSPLPPSHAKTTADVTLTLTPGSYIQRPSSEDEENRQSSSGPPSPDHPTTAGAHSKERWNRPRGNIPRVASCFYSFVVMGANDAAYGPLIPYLQAYYHLSYLIISLIFLSPFIGYTAAAFLNNYIHTRGGRRGVALVASCSHLLAYIVIALHPPYPVLVIAFALAGFGNGIADAGWNAFIGNMDRANELLGILHGLYGVGAVLSPLIATSMIVKAGLPWFAFYYLMVGLASLEIIITGTGFWKASAREYCESVAASSGSPSAGGLKEVLFRNPEARVSWLCALFLLGYVGLEVALGGWIVDFMINVRHGGAFESGITATGFWLGLTIGRFVLGFVTPRIGEKLAIMIYLPITMGLELLFWLVPQFIVSAVAVGLQGFCLGPLFPAAIVAMSKLLPHHLHVGAIGFAAAFGGSGAAFLPFVVGAVAQAKGVQVLQPIILALLAAIFLVWW